MTTNPEPWIAKGGTAAVTTGGAYGRTEFVTIDRLTDTQIVLADGRRYRRVGHHRQLNAPRNQPDTRLVDPQNPAIVAMFARQKYREVLAAAEQPTRSSAPLTLDKMTPAQVTEQLDRLRDVLNAARKEIDRRASL
jgi:hypothetical protein